MKNSYFFSQVHQVFFALAFINAIVFMLLFMLSFKGVLALSVDVTLFHSFSLIFLFFTPAFLGFLLTTFPRFLAALEISKDTYLKIFYLFVLATITNIIGAFTSSIIYSISILFTLVALSWAVKLMYNINKNSLMDDKHDTNFMLIGFFSGILSLIVFLSGLDNNLAIQIAIYNFLFVVAFSVAQRMIPFFSHVMPIRIETFLRNVVILLAVHTIFEFIYKDMSFGIELILAFYIGFEIYRWKLPFPNANPMISILHIALFWIPIAFFIGSITKALSLFNNNMFLALDIHSLMLGFLFTVLIGFGTRVTIGHSGNMMVATPYVKFLFVFTQIVVLVRLAVSIVASFGYNFMIVFDISITMWLLMFLFWLYKFFAVIVFGKKLNS